MMKPPLPLLRRAAPMLAALLLAACSERDVREVNTWMAQVKQQTKVAVPPLTEPKTFVPFVYASNGAVDPFSADKLLSELAKDVKQGKGIKPDADRRKDVLEGFPLDTMKMVGTIQDKTAMYALLQIDKVHYRARAGEHIGTDYGLVTSVTASAVNIKETVQDASGDWVERISKLELQESQEIKK
jgi:type IV pilus assembly protein PilP